MRKPYKIALVVIIVLLILFIAGIFISNSIIKSKVENFLTNSLPGNLQVEYKNIKVSSLSGRVSLIQPSISNFGNTTGKLNSILKMDILIVDGCGYWDYFFEDNITVSSIRIKRPNLIYYHNKLVDEKEYKYPKLERLKKNITVNTLQIFNGKLEVKDLQTDSLLLKFHNFDGRITSLKINGNSVKKRIPFLFGDYSVSMDELFFKLNSFENLEINNSKISKNQSQFNGLKLYTKYSKQQLTQMISVERDHFDVKIDSLVLENQEFGYKNDSLFFFMVPKVVFYKPEMNLYRNKLVGDDLTTKDMYSRSLRDLKFDLTLSEILLKNASIIYSEKVKPENKPAKISFTHMNANIKNFSNTYKSPEKTTLDINAVFMKSTPIKVDWYFDVNNANDHFIFKADIGKLPAQDLNPFSEPNLNVQFEGELIKTYFTIDGNFVNSSVDLRTNYDNFKVTVLEKDGKDKNRLLSAIANLFIKNDSDNKPDDFREGSKSEIERNQTKSVFNFLWLNARAGLLSALTGNGKK